MNNLIFQKPFHEYHNTVGTLSKGTVTLQNIQLIIFYSNIQQGDINGLVLGTSHLFDELMKLNNSDGHYIYYLSDDKLISSNSITIGEKLKGVVATKCLKKEFSFWAKALDYFLVQIPALKRGANEIVRSILPLQLKRA